MTAIITGSVNAAVRVPGRSPGRLTSVRHPAMERGSPWNPIRFERCLFGRMATLAPIGALSFLVGMLSIEGSHCVAVENGPETEAPRILMPAGVVPQIGPLEAADLARREDPLTAVTCIELLPPSPTAAPGSNATRQRWIVHVDARWSTIVRGARGSCTAPHYLAVVADEVGAVPVRQGLDRRCDVRPYDVLRVR